MGHAPDGQATNCQTILAAQCHFHTRRGVERVEGSNVPLILINAGKSDWRDKNSRRTKIRLGPEAV